MYDVKLQAAAALQQSEPVAGVSCCVYVIVMELTGPITDDQNTRGRKIYAPEETSMCFGLLTTQPIPVVITPCYISNLLLIYKSVCLHLSVPGWNDMSVGQSLPVTVDLYKDTVVIVGMHISWIKYFEMTSTLTPVNISVTLNDPAEEWCFANIMLSLVLLMKCACNANINIDLLVFYCVLAFAAKKSAHLYFKKRFSCTPISLSFHLSPPTHPHFASVCRIKKHDFAFLGTNVSSFHKIRGGDCVS